MRRLTVAILVLAALIAGAALLACHRAPLRGIDFGAAVDPFRRDGSVDPEDVASEPVYRLVLVGDAGNPEPEDPTLELVGLWGDARPDRTAALFLGDNVYPAGLDDADRERGERILLQLLDSTRARKVFLPGNHDWGFRWNRGHAPGVLGNQQKFVEAHAARRADFLPKHGCPGPVPVELLAPGRGLSGGLVVLVLDLHWWLLDVAERPVCDGVGTTTEFVARLRRELETRRDENVVVAAHHPIRSGGPHGGYTRGFWSDLGLAIFYRFYAVQDMFEPSYREMVTVLSEVLSEDPPLAMVAGHDHSLQILDGGDEARLVVVSGAASKVSRVTSTEDTIFAHAHRGFVVLDFHDAPETGGEVLLARVVETGKGEAPVATIGLDLGRKESRPEAVPTPGRSG